MEEGLKIDKQLLAALDVDYWNGFGFQCDSTQRERPFRMYIAKLKEGDAVNCVQQLQEKLGMTPDDIWSTDYLGYEFLTINVRHYGKIPLIFNTMLGSGYSVVTHTRPNVRFAPGDEFSRRNFELKIIDFVLTTFDEFSKMGMFTTEREVWQYMYRTCYLKSLTYHWNWATQEGREFCILFREKLGKKKPRSIIQPRMKWKEYDAAAQKYNVLHRGGWGAYEPDLGVESPKKKRRVGQDCVVCLDNTATTCVVSCGHRVVCDECSVELGNTANSALCVICRQKITHVFYEKDNRVEKK